MPANTLNTLKGSNMSQPEWECIAQLGDASPLEYGGYWIFRDKTGVYCEEAERLDVGTEEGDGGTAYRFILEKCTWVNGVLSDNQFHPGHPAWFAQPETEVRRTTSLLKNLAEFAGRSLIDEFCSDDPLERARAYESVGEYHGFGNLDHEPLELTEQEIQSRYADERYRVVTE